jgi:DNA-directed RNA polymerase sigma subunit (sigma70/sigma32)
MSSRFTDDSELDAVAAQVRSFVPLSAEEVAGLLGEARASPGGGASQRLVEEHLGAVLGSVLARRGPDVSVMDLYQEGSVAATVAVGEYAARGGPSGGLRAYVARVVDTFLDDVLERVAAEQVADALVVEQVTLFEAAELLLRGRLEREPTTLELAAAMDWTPEQVEVVRDALQRARETSDSEIVAYLDDADDAEDTADI